MAYKEIDLKDAKERDEILIGEMWLRLVKYGVNRVRVTVTEIEEDIAK